MTEERVAVRWDMTVNSENSIAKSTWNIFPGGTWEVDFPGKSVWIELKADESHCLIERLLGT